MARVKISRMAAWVVAGALLAGCTPPGPEVAAVVDGKEISRTYINGLVTLVTENAGQAPPEGDAAAVLAIGRFAINVAGELYSEEQAKEVLDAQAEAGQIAGLQKGKIPQAVVDLFRYQQIDAILKQNGPREQFQQEVSVAFANGKIRLNPRYGVTSHGVGAPTWVLTGAPEPNAQLP